MAEQTASPAEKERAMAACQAAAAQFELTAGALRARFYQARSQPGGLTPADEKFLEDRAVSDAAGGRSAAFQALHPEVKAVVNAYESGLRPANLVHAGILAGTMFLGWAGRFTGLYRSDPDQVRRGSRYSIEVTRALQVAQLLRARAAEIAGR